MTTYKITPNSNCKFCHGSGIVYDIVDYGSTTASMPSDCGCVDEQLPEDFDYLVDEVKIVENTHKHKWIERRIIEPNFKVLMGAVRECECGAKEFCDYAEGRHGGDWRPVKKSKDSNNDQV